MAKQISPEEMAEQQDYLLQVRQLQQNKKAMLLTYGCQQNENDSERLRGMLAEMGYGFTEDTEQADLILFNTCAVRENAELKVYGKLGALKHVKRRKPSLCIGVCGCMTQQETVSKTIQKRYPHVDFVFGTHALYRFPSILYHALQQKRIFDVECEEGRIAESIPILRNDPFKAGVSIMYGCNNFCSYCIVPYVRGRERSRQLNQVVDEVKTLAQSGCKEVMLLGQNVNSYGKDLDCHEDFADLLHEVAQVSGIERIRFMTSHPKDISEKLVQCMADHDNICNQLHLPFQSGSNRILEKMNRRYTKEHYLSLIALVRSYLPDVALSSDVIVGFPGETEEDFLETLDVVRQVRFDHLYTFLYSKRPGTPAAEMPDLVSQEEKQNRFERLLELQNVISRQINEELVGKVLPVLVEGKSKTDKDKLSGRTEGNKLVHFTGEESLCGKVIPLCITKAQTWSLTGEQIKGE